jgi:hypothetical protein
MRVRRGKDAFNRDARVNLAGKVFKLTPMHLLAHVFIKPPFNARNLRGTAGYCYDKLVLPFLILIPDQQ